MVHDVLSFFSARCIDPFHIVINTSFIPWSFTSYEVPERGFRSTMLTGERHSVCAPVAFLTVPLSPIPAGLADLAVP